MGGWVELHITYLFAVTKLPNPDRAIIDDQKLVGYCLNPNHADGQHKANVFQSALGIGLDEVAELKAALRSAVWVYDAIPGKSNQSLNAIL